MSDVIAITGIAVGGDGVGRLADGRAVFVPRTAPGDRVRVRPGSLELRRRFARAAPGEIVADGPDRVVPPCPHYTRDRCGGCQLQHLAYDAQLAAKRAIVHDTLRRIGKLDVPDFEIVEATAEWRYRAKLSLSVKSVRASARPAVGLHPYDQPNAVFPLADCHITDFRLMALWREIKTRLDLLPPQLACLTLRLDRDGGAHVIAEARDGWSEADAERLAAALRAAGQPARCWWDTPAGGGGGPAATHVVGAFEQVNPEMGAVARRWAVAQLGEVRGRTVWDLYGGLGDTAALLVERGADVISVDADERTSAWARRHVPAARCIAARAEDVLGSLPPPYAVIVNPPRGGLHWNVTLRLTAEPVPHVAYVSCDPATLARDLHRLDVNYALTALRAFDLFPQTAHVETVAVLEAA